MRIKLKDGKRPRYAVLLWHFMNPDKLSKISFRKLRAGGVIDIPDGALKISGALWFDDFEDNETPSGSEISDDPKSNNEEI